MVCGIFCIKNLVGVVFSLILNLFFLFCFFYVLYIWLVDFIFMFEFIVLFINIYLDINFVYFVVDYMKFILLVDWLILKLFVMLN